MSQEHFADQQMAMAPAQPQVILDRDGYLHSYNPASYLQAQRMAVERSQPRSFNAMQVHDVSRPQIEVKQQAIETQMLALPGNMDDDGTQPAYPPHLAAAGSTGGLLVPNDPYGQSAYGSNQSFLR